MAEMEDKLGAILNNPQMMQQIMTMAKSLGSTQETPKQNQSAPAGLPDLDPAMLQKLSGLAGQSAINPNEQALLSALGPYISSKRVHKLEKAMRAEKMARLASMFLSQGGSSILTGR